MFNFLKHNITMKRSVGLALTGVLLSLGQTCWADECHFGWYGEGGTSTLANAEYTKGPIRLPSADSSFNSVGDGGFRVNMSPTVQTECDAGTDGDNLQSQTAPGLIIGNKNGNAIFATNIPGIGYTVRIHTAESDGGTGGYFAMNTTGWTDLTGGVPTSMWAGRKSIVATVYLYAGPDYVGNPNKATVIKPKAGTLGKMAIGDPTDSDNQPWTFMVDENSFQIPVVLPTCDIAMLSDGTNDVNLGDYFVSDIKNNKVKDVPFSIHLNSCTSVARFTTKLTSTKLTGTNNDLLGNTITSGAEGAGVKIMYNGTSQLIPNNSSSSYVMTDASLPGSTQIDYVAQLVANGSTVKPGAFKATGVFTLSYD